MFCPRCGAENSDDRAACWNCYAQLRQAADAKGRKPEKPSKADRKKGKGEPEPAPEPVIPETAVQEPAPAAVEEPIPELEPEAHAPFVTPPPPVEVSAEDEVDTSPVARESAPVPLDVLESVRITEPPPSPAPEPGESTFVAGIPLGGSAEEAVEMTDRADDDAKAIDLDAPIEDSTYVIPGLAETEPEAEDQPDDDGGRVLDLDSEVPDDKT